MSSQGAAASAASLPPFLAAIEALPRTRPPPANSSSQPQARRGQTALLQQPLTKREHLWQTFLLIDAESSEKHKAVMMGLPGNAWSCLDALATQSVERNRYTNVVPYNHNRVRLGFVDPSRRSGGAVGASKAGSTERRDGEESAGKSSSTRTQNVKGDASLSQPRSIGRNDASSYRNGQKDGSVCNDQENEFCDYFNARLALPTFFYLDLIVWHGSVRSSSTGLKLHTS
ncbi:hypothetical protein M427DRAFT_430578 [Gonapodya prolifera JEL478]|uniref:Uncharacterized protein n=1 Tax=Gonapodya prolifera (strain JEL478) TaxID=1344416 RepID=A0A139ASV7_GONPJ|nr:hypothetical protein M427DRAFT_430578 [Gonapodya prolifera JEL478]|eukprot:KXS19816.1 hypothetical protein M427DRAFT_430578 [Gonapodya prolifera JEL478]